MDADDARAQAAASAAALDSLRAEAQRLGSSLEGSERRLAAAVEAGASSDAEATRMSAAFTAARAAHSDELEAERVRWREAGPLTLTSLLLFSCS